MKQTHAILDGAVYCAHARRPVELERCFACPRLIDLDLDTAHPRVVCDIPPEEEEQA